MKINGEVDYPWGRWITGRRAGILHTCAAKKEGEVATLSEGEAEDWPPARTAPNATSAPHGSAITAGRLSTNPGADWRSLKLVAWAILGLPRSRHHGFGPGPRITPPRAAACQLHRLMLRLDRSSRKVSILTIAAAMTARHNLRPDLRRSLPKSSDKPG